MKGLMWNNVTGPQALHPPATLAISPLIPPTHLRPTSICICTIGEQLVENHKHKPLRTVLRRLPCYMMSIARANLYNSRYLVGVFLQKGDWSQMVLFPRRDNVVSVRALNSQETLMSFFIDHPGHKKTRFLSRLWGNSDFLSFFSNQTPRETSIHPLFNRSDHRYLV